MRKQKRRWIMKSADNAHRLKAMVTGTHAYANRGLGAVIRLRSVAAVVLLASRTRYH